MEQLQPVSRGLEPWAEFNRIKWGCEAKILRFQREDSEAYIESLFFLNKRGKIYLPPLNPFHPTVFQPTPTDKPYRLNRQWHQTAEVMIGELLRYGGSAAYCFPPDIRDIRPFLWKGFKADVKYTYQIRLPHSLEQASPGIRNRIKKAVQEGYRCGLTHNMAEVHACLLETETRKGFSHRLSLEDLQLAQRLLGDDGLRCYVCYSPSGEPVTASVILILDGRRALFWMAGSKTEHLSHGVVQLSQHAVFDDLAAVGLQDIDLVGANLQSVARSKSGWGGELVSYYQIRLPIFKDLARTSLDWLRFHRRKRLAIFQEEGSFRARG